MKLFVQIFCEEKEVTIVGIQDIKYYKTTIPMSNLTHGKS